ncbi:MAG: phosphotransacetylase family protein [Chloroflexi bacterium]|nr:phosphotransacetylase family protein [Chloroflexota bacterium]
MTVLYVASDQEGAGKTALCAALAQIMKRKGNKVAIFKPVASAGQNANPDLDTETYRKLLDQTSEDQPLDLSSAGLTPELLEQAKAAFDRVSDGADVVVVEGSSGLSASDAKTLVEALDAKVVIVSRYDRDLSAFQMKPWQAVFGKRIVGYVINGLTRYAGTEANAKLPSAMESEGLRLLGIIPEDRRLLGVTVNTIMEHLEGRLISRDGDVESLVEHFMVLGLTMDPGELYFGLRENKAVIVRGDRPDIQMAALATPTSCLVCTRGVEPIEYVRYEAEQEEVPLIVVESDTLATMDAMNGLLDRARFDHPRKLTRFTELLEQHIDLPVIFQSLGLES